MSKYHYLQRFQYRAWNKVKEQMEFMPLLLSDDYELMACTGAMDKYMVFRCEGDILKYVSPNRGLTSYYRVVYTRRGLNFSLFRINKQGKDVTIKLLSSILDKKAINPIIPYAEIIGNQYEHEYLLKKIKEGKLKW